MPQQLSESPSTALLTLDRLCQHLAGDYKPEFLNSLRVTYERINGHELLIAEDPIGARHLYVRVPFHKDPEKGLYCIFPMTTLIAHGIVLHAMLRVIAKPCVVDESKASGGFVNSPRDQNFSVFGRASLFDADHNDELQSLLKQLWQGT